MTGQTLRYEEGGLCVWASAGLLAEWNCDRQFDCDRCPLHQALSRMAGRRRAHRLVWPKDRLYSESHFWLKRTSEKSALVGLTETAASLLHPVTKWRIQSSARGTPVVSADLACGRVVLFPPVRASRLVANSCLDVDPLWPAADAWISGYLMEVEVSDPREIGAEWLELEQTVLRYSHHRELIDRALQKARSRTAERPAGRMADGGLPLSGLLPVVGRPAYVGLVASILGCGVLAR